VTEHPSRRKRKLTHGNASLFIQRKGGRRKKRGKKTLPFRTRKSPTLAAEKEAPPASGWGERGETLLKKKKKKALFRLRGTGKKKIGGKLILGERAKLAGRRTKKGREMSWMGGKKKK